MFITLEGMDGSGKTTAIQKIKSTLEHLGYQVVYTREPGGEKVAEEIRQLILTEQSAGIDGWTEALLFLAARREHLVKVIIPALESGKIVISDRFMDSTSAYQGNARGIGIDNVDEVQKIVIGKYIPDLTIFFSVDPKEAEKRMSMREDLKNRLDAENEKFKAKVKEGYEILIKKYPNRFKVVNTNLPVSEVQKETEKIILEAIKHHGKK
ncbi:thymidylate kinase [Williamsoniiplasma luminosum]|uniref:Thymidylate kinase n=1 Tax=Williamsoniiplasma luminosum TaxID=214888 RepID=A0A2K8NSR2_9MOLU|nr:dTMP kinase [Williamsoniiplasma luminosum]ATZ16880.1 thymidylate kinase [Williamsoniiplasma luminosum]